jgi:hypothetical protein
MTTMRAQEDSGIHGRIVDFDRGHQQGKFYREKEVVAIYVAASLLRLVGSARGKNACMFASVVGDVVA